ncbi:MAG: phage baseplate assembly protein V [Spirochaetia bacterium]
MEENVIYDVVTWIKIHYFGKYRGTVTDVNDSTKRGRIKVKVPAVLDDQEVWAMPCVAYAGENIGSYLIPKQGSGVWIEFEGGDPSYPVWTGCFWADNEAPKDIAGTQAAPHMKIIRSERGLMVTMNDQPQEITVSDEDGNNQLFIEVQQGKVTVKGNLKVVVEAPKIELVENAAHPVVFGDELLKYLQQLVMNFNTHLHIGQLALGVYPVTPTIPSVSHPTPTDVLISKKVTSD